MYIYEVGEGQGMDGNELAHHNSKLVEAKNTVSIEVEGTDDSLAVVDGIGLPQSTQHPLQAGMSDAARARLSLVQSKSLFEILGLLFL